MRLPQFPYSSFEPQSVRSTSIRLDGFVWHCIVRWRCPQLLYQAPCEIKLTLVRLWMAEIRALLAGEATNGVFLNT